VVHTTTIGASPEAIAYQRQLLGLLGDDDPADVQAATPASVRAILREAGPDLRTRPEPGEWSVLECIGHVLDAELVSAGRYRFILAHDRPDLPGYDQDAWADAFHHNDVDPDELLAPFEALRSANLALWRRSTAADRARVGMHRERGPESYDLTFRMIAGHDRFHLNQARDTLASIRSTGDRP
jgi:hypothetical protein